MSGRAFNKNPICRDLNFNCSVGLTPSKPWNEFTISLEGLIELVDHLWNKFYFATLTDDSDLDDDEMLISKSCFSYYIWQHVYARIVEIKSFRQTLNLSKDIEQFKQYIDYIRSYPVPEEIVRYLSSIGDIRDETGTEFILDFPFLPNEEGHFGRVAADTHYKYETMAAPIVIAQRIMQDYSYTRNGGEQTWNLPEEIVPIETNAGLPTKNLVGWDLREKLNIRQIHIIESAGITFDSFNSTIRRFMFNEDLFSRISDCFYATAIKTVCFKSYSIAGSESQIPWLYLEESANFYRTHYYTHSALEFASFCCLNKQFVHEASAFCFRVRKDRIESLDSYCCYDFNCYKEIPNDWRMTRNTVFEYGDVAVWNLSTFYTNIIRRNFFASVINSREANNNVPKLLLLFRKKFTITFEGLPGIINETYNLLTLSNRLFTDNIARSVFSYYVWMHLFARIVKISHLYRHPDHDCFFMKQVRTCPIPSPIEKYLSSIGNVENQFGINFEIDFPVWPNENGHFGRVDKDTHYKYETMAAPAVLAQRIMEDMAYTKNMNGVRIWDLRDIAPDEQNAGLPTKNLLGWGLRERLTSKQLLLIESAGITNYDFHVDHKRFMFNQSLINAVAARFGSNNEKVEIENASKFETGSVYQMIWQKRDEREEEVFDRLIQYCERPLRQISFRYYNNKIVTASLLCSFRVRKDTIGNLNSYCCYDFNGYREVPDDWQNTRNAVFEFGEIGSWNECKFRSDFTTKDPYRRNWIKHLLKM